MVSDQYKFIFIQIPKTGCTSVGSVLKNNANGISYNGASAPKKSIYFKHITYREIQKQLSRETLGKYFKFTFVRNPWDWLVSNYFYCRGVHYPYYYRVKGSRKKLRTESMPLNFNEWVKWYVEKLHGTQFEMIANLTEDCELDFIGKFENIHNDFNIICNKIGIPSQKLPHKNKTKHTHYTEYYDDETRQIVVEKYAKDIEYFGYEYGK